MRFFRPILAVSLFFMLFFLPVSGQGSRVARKAKRLTNKLKFEKALALCNRWLEDHPLDAEVYLARGDVYFNLFDLLDAEEDYDRATSLGYWGEDTTFLRMMCDTAWMVKVFVGDSLKRARLDPLDDYRYRPTHADTLRGMLTPLRRCYDIVHERLHVKVMPEDSSIAGSNDLLFRVVADSCSRMQIDLFTCYGIDSILLEGETVHWERDSNAIFVTFPQVLRRDTLVTLRVVYHGHPPVAPNPPWDGGFVWKKKNGRYQVGVACEQLGASSWWPTKDHLSDKPDSMDILITVPAGYAAVANGNAVDTLREEGWDTFHWHVSYPIVNYDVSFYMGDYLDISEPYTTLAFHRTRIDYYLGRDHVKKAKAFYAPTKRIVSDIESFYGEYPFPRDGLGYVEAPYTGMEHQGAIAIGAVYDDDTSGYEVVEGYPMLVVHETAHEWWGNAVSLEDMADLWLNEGLATYTEHLFLEKEFGRKKYLEETGNSMLRVNNIWPVVGPRDINYDAFMGQDVYYKGAAMLHSLRSVFNDDEAFFKMLKDFFEKYRYRNANTFDFILHAEKYTKKPLRDFFFAYLFQKHPPVLEYSMYRYRKSYIFRYHWNGVPEDFQMPFLVLAPTLHRLEAGTEMSVVRVSDCKNLTIVTPLILELGFLPDDLKSSTYFYTRYVPFSQDEIESIRKYLKEGEGKDKSKQ